MEYLDIEGSTGFSHRTEDSLKEEFSRFGTVERVGLFDPPPWRLGRFHQGTDRVEDHAELCVILSFKSVHPIILRSQIATSENRPPQNLRKKMHRLVHDEKAA
ncbi:MAG: hypothetical protein AABY80_09660 [Candidatus Deferrimicrobiota bacterium]